MRSGRLFRTRWLVPAGLLFAAIAHPAVDSNDQAAIHWLRQNAIPIQTVEAGHGFADLEPLKKVVGDARIVELGEATHGTREFFQLKHRIVEFLARQEGFTIFSIEANMPEAYRVNDFVLNGNGDPKELLKGMYFWTWNTEEVLDMILWMREFNKSGRGKIEFTGFDMQTPTVSIDTVRKFALSRDSDYFSATLDLLYGELLQMHRQGQSSLAAAAGQHDAFASLLPRCEEVVRHLETNRAQYSEEGSTKESIDWAIQNARLVLQYVQLKSGAQSRDESMAENVKWIADENPEAKIIVWAHNGHVSNTGFSGTASMGSYLRKIYGKQLVNFGFAFNEGSFRAKDIQAADFSHGLRTGIGQGLRNFTVGPAPEGSLDWTLAAVGIPIFAVDLRQVPKEGPVAQWFGEPHASRSVGAGYSDSLAPKLWSYNPANVDFDVLLFVEKTTEARPNL